MPRLQLCCAVQAICELLSSTPLTLLPSRLDKYMKTGRDQPSQALQRTTFARVVQELPIHAVPTCAGNNQAVTSFLTAQAPTPGCPTSCSYRTGMASGRSTSRSGSRSGPTSSAPHVNRTAASPGALRVWDCHTHCQCLKRVERGSSFPCVFLCPCFPSALQPCT